MNKDWLNQLPPFVSIARVASLFDQAPLTVRRWVKDPDNPMRGEKLDNGQYIVPREDVVRLANELYGTLEARRGTPEAARAFLESGCESRDGVDRPGDVRPQA